MSTAPAFDGTQPCLKVNPEIFFPELPKKPTSINKSEYRHAVMVAKRECDRCRFINKCLDYSLKNDVLGIWGGTTEKERSIIRKARGITKPKSITLVTKAWVNKRAPVKALFSI